MQVRNYGSCYMRNIGKHSRSDSGGDFTDALEVDYARVGRGAADNKFGLMFFGDALQFVVINLFGLARDSVVRNFVTDTGEVHWMAVRQVTTVRKVHAQDLIAVLDSREVDSHVCLRAAVRLNVGVF